MSFVDRLLGVTPAAPDGLPELPTQAPRGRQAEQLLAAQMLEQLRIMSNQLTSVAAQFQGFVQDGLLESTTYQFDAGGFVHCRHKAEVGAIDLRNLGSTAVTVVVGGPSSGAQLTGRGVWVVPAGVRETVPIGGTQFTVYGAAGDRFSVAAYTWEARPTS